MNCFEDPRILKAYMYVCRCEEMYDWNYPNINVSYCKFLFYWVGINTKFTIWQHIVNFVFTPTL